MPASLLQRDSAPLNHVGEEGYNSITGEPNSGNGEWEKYKA